MANGKWISDLGPDTSVTDAARRVLAARLEVVRDRLRLAVHESDQDVEHVHQLRVATRRAAAALEIFACCLSEKARKAARKHLRLVRRAAGAARDWDVFLQEAVLGMPRRPGRQQAGLDFLIGFAVAERTRAQAELVKASPHYPFDLERMLAETVVGVHKPGGHPTIRTLRELAQPMLTAQIEGLDRAVTADLSDYRNLHQVRILGKQLRYAMEVFADCFAPPFRDELYPAIEEMQEILGRANDSHVAGQRLEDLCQRIQAIRPGDWDRYRLRLESLSKYHQDRLQQESVRFREWWQQWLEEGREAALRGLVQTPDDPTQLAR